MAHGRLILPDAKLETRCTQAHGYAQRSGTLPPYSGRELGIRIDIMLIAA